MEQVKRKRKGRVKGKENEAYDQTKKHLKETSRNSRPHKGAHGFYEKKDERGNVFH